MRKTKFVCVLMMLVPLCACGAAGKNNSAQEAALAARAAYLSAEGCTARLDVTADYGRRVYTYAVDVTVTGEDTALTVTAPEEIAGVTARVHGGDGALEFDGAAVETGPLSDAGLTPLGAIPALLSAARSGFMDSSTYEALDGAQTLRILCRDPAQNVGRGQEVTLWLDPDGYALLRGEIALDGRRVIDCRFSEFSLNT